MAAGDTTIGPTRVALDAPAFDVAQARAGSDKNLLGETAAKAFERERNSDLGR